MILYKLIGYNELTDTYINPNTGEKENIPMPTFTIANTVPDNYSEFNGPDNWAVYGAGLVGSIYGLREYISLRYEIYTRIELIAGIDYSLWDNLTAAQKNIAIVWCNVRIVNAKGMTFYVQKCGSQDMANFYISDYLDKSNIARDYRYYVAFTVFGYTYLGKLQGIKAESFLRHDFLDTTYIDRGVVYKTVDGIDGIGDWILGTNGFSITGLKPRIIAGEFILGGGMNVDTFCDTLVGMLDEGLF
jgi:hypothetical protein